MQHRLQPLTTLLRVFGTTGRLILPYQLAVLVKLIQTKCLQVQKWLPEAQETSASLDDVISRSVRAERHPA